ASRSTNCGTSGASGGRPTRRPADATSDAPVPDANAAVSAASPEARLATGAARERPRRPATVDPPSRASAGNLAAQNLELVPQHQQLDVLPPDPPARGPRHQYWRPAVSSVISAPVDPLSDRVEDSGTDGPLQCFSVAARPLRLGIRPQDVAQVVDHLHFTWACDESSNRIGVPGRNLHVVSTDHGEHRDLDTFEDRDRVIVHELAEPACVQLPALDPDGVGRRPPDACEGLPLAL